MKEFTIDGIVRKCYPLTPAQKLHFFTVMTCGKPQVVNIGTGLYVQSDVDFNVLKDAIYLAYERHECMRIRFYQEEDKNVWQYIEPKETRDIELHDYRHWQEEDISNQLTNFTKIPFETFGSPLNRIIMIQMPDGYNGIYLNVHHMIMDSSSLVLLLRDILEIYCAKMYPEQVKFPEPMQSYIKCLEKDLKYPTSKTQEKDREYWDKVLNQSEPMYTDFAGEGRLLKARLDSNNPNKRSATIVSESNDAKISVYHLEENPSKEIMEFCKEHSIPLVCVLLMGLRTVLSIYNNNEKDVSIKTTVARRATLLEKKSGGTRIHFFPCRTIIEPEETFLDGLRQMQLVQNTIFRHANFDPIEHTIDRIKKLNMGHGESYESISLTYQPASMRDDNPSLPANYKTQWYSNGVSAQPLYLTVMHRANDNGLDFYFEHQHGVVSKEELDVLYYYICRVIFRGMENFDKPIKNMLQLV